VPITPTRVDATERIGCDPTDVVRDSPVARLESSGPCAFSPPSSSPSDWRPNMASPGDSTSRTDVSEEIARLEKFVVHLDGYWQRAQRRGLSAQRRRLIEGSLIAAHRRIVELSAPMGRPMLNRYQSKAGGER
jgi:hypothetical protein